MDGTRPFDLTIAAGPYAQAWSGTGGSGGPVRMSIWCRRSLAGTLPGLERFAGLARQALEYYERMLGVPCPYPKYDIGFVPRLDALAISMPGLMLVSENLLARMADPDDDFVAMVCAHEVSHLWFGCHISSRWWDDLWLDEAMASYVSYLAMAEAGMADPWTALSYREKPRAYEADALPGRQPVSSPVATAADALSRPVALTYSKGTAVIRQLAALIGDDALRAGLADYMRRFGGGTASLDDLIGCWSRSSGRDLSGWAQEWLRTEGASTLRASVEAGADGTLASLAVEQDEPRTHRLGIGLYDRSGPGSVLRRRRVISAEVSGARCEIPVPPGEPVPAAVVPNDGDLTYARDLVRPGHPGGAGRGGDEHRRPDDRGGVLERGLADGDVRRAVRRRPGRPGDPAAGRRPRPCPRSGSKSCSAGPSPPPTSTRPIPNGAGRVPPWPPRAWPGRAPRRVAAQPSARWRPDSQPARTPAISWRRRARGWTAGRGRTAWISTVTCAGACCARWRPAGSPPMRTWTRWPPRTRWPGSGTGRPAWPRGRTPRPRKRRGNWRSAAGTGG